MQSQLHDRSTNPGAAAQSRSPQSVHHTDRQTHLAERASREEPRKEGEEAREERRATCDRQPLLLLHNRHAVRLRLSLCKTCGSRQDTLFKGRSGKGAAARAPASQQKHARDTLAATRTLAPASGERACVCVCVRQRQWLQQKDRQHRSSLATTTVFALLCSRVTLSRLATLALRATDSGSVSLAPDTHTRRQPCSCSASLVYFCCPSHASSPFDHWSVSSRVCDSGCSLPLLPLSCQRLPSFARLLATTASLT